MIYCTTGRLRSFRTLLLTVSDLLHVAFLKNWLFSALSRLSVDVTLDLQLQRAISGLWLTVHYLDQRPFVLMANDGGFKILTLDCR